MTTSTALARARELYADHPDRARANGREQSRKQYAAHPERTLLRAQRWAAAHPLEVRMKYRRMLARRKQRDPNADLTSAQWWALVESSHGRCQYCLTVMVTEEISVDHVEPNKNGGSLTMTNVVPACLTCNCGMGGKGAKTVEQWLGPQRAAAFRRRHARLLAQARRLLE